MSWGEYGNRISGQYGHFEAGQGYVDASLKIPGYGEVTFKAGERPEPPKWAEKLGSFFKKAGLVVGGILSFAVAVAIFPITLIGVLLLHIAREKNSPQDEFNPLYFTGAILALPLIGAVQALMEAGIIQKSRQQ